MQKINIIYMPLQYLPPSLYQCYSLQDDFLGYEYIIPRWLQTEPSVLGPLIYSVTSWAS